MDYIIGAIAVVIWLGLGVFSAIALFDCFDEGNIKQIIVGLIGIIICIASLFYVADQDPNKNKPCVKYETTLQYNAALKMTMPVTSCAEYGEWVTK